MPLRLRVGDVDLPRRELRRLTGAVAMASFLVIFFESWRPAWSIDEVITLGVVQQPLDDVWLTTDTDAALSPFYLLINAWATVSTTAVWLRLPSVIAMAAAVASVFWLVARMTDRRLGLAAAAAGVLLVLPAVSRYGHEARPYALTFLACVLATACWYSFLRERRLSRAAGMCLWLVLAGLLHAFSLLIVLPWAATAILAPVATRRRDLVATAAPVAVAIAVLAPFLLHVAANANRPGAPEFSVLNAAEELLRLPPGVLRPSLALALACLSLAAGAAGCLLGWRRGDTHKTVAVLAAAWFALPPTFLTGLTALTDSKAMVTRYWLFCLPGLAMAIGLALFASGRRRPFLGIAAAVLLTALALPTHLAIRGVDGHVGQRWAALPAVLDQPSLAGLPLLTEPWNYTGLLAHDPGVPPSRVPLLSGPPSDGQILPGRIGVGSYEFNGLVTSGTAVIVYGMVDEPFMGIPSTGSFPSFADELEYFSRPLVMCNYFEAPLGVFALPSATDSVDSSGAMAEQIESVAPSMIRCSANVATTGAR